MNPDHGIRVVVKTTSMLPGQTAEEFLFEGTEGLKIFPYFRLSTSESKTGTIQRKKVKRKKSAVDQKKWIFKGRIATELMEIENLEDGASKLFDDLLLGGITSIRKTLIYAE